MGLLDSLQAQANISQCAAMIKKIKIPNTDSAFFIFTEHEPLH
jgi:hypothetical protein